MHQLTHPLFSGIQAFYRLVIDLLLTCEGHSEEVFVALELLRVRLNYLVPILHECISILSVEGSIFLQHVMIYFVIQGFKIINIQFVRCGPSMLHKTISSKGLHIESSFVQDPVLLHAPVLVA